MFSKLHVHSVQFSPKWHLQAWKSPCVYFQYLFFGSFPNVALKYVPMLVWLMFLSQSFRVSSLCKLNGNSQVLNLWAVFPVDLNPESQGLFGYIFSVLLRFSRVPVPGCYIRERGCCGVTIPGQLHSNGLASERIFTNLMSGGKEGRCQCMVRTLPWQLFRLLLYQNEALSTHSYW